MIDLTLVISNEEVKLRVNNASISGRVVFPKGKLKSAFTSDLFPNLIVFLILSPEKNIVTINAGREIRQFEAAMVSLIVGDEGGCHVDKTEDRKAGGRTHQLTPTLLKQLTVLFVSQVVTSQTLLQEELIL
jgi:hypothetical protein